MLCTANGVINAYTNRQEKAISRMALHWKKGIWKINDKQKEKKYTSPKNEWMNESNKRLCKHKLLLRKFSLVYMQIDSKLNVYTSYTQIFNINNHKYFLSALFTTSRPNKCAKTERKMEKNIITEMLLQTNGLLSFFISYFNFL